MCMGIFCFIEGFLSDHSCNNIKELIATLVNMKIIFTFLFFPYIALLIAKVSLMATFCHEKEMKDTIKKHASHIRFSNEVLMKYKPLKLFINFALVTESIQTSKKNLCCCYKWFMTLDRKAALYFGAIYAVRFYVSFIGTLRLVCNLLPPLLSCVRCLQRGNKELESWFLF